MSPPGPSFPASSGLEGHCPTCRAAWRGVRACTRCGTDLSVLMRLVHRAWQLREAARLELCAGRHPAEALVLARAACRLHMTPQGQCLLVLALLANGQLTEAYGLVRDMGQEA